VDEQSIIEKVKSEGQAHVLRYIDELSDQQRKSLLSELEAVDFEKVNELASLIGKEEEEIDFDRVEPAPVEKLMHKDSPKEQRAIQAGEEALRDDRVACVTVAGGQGTRLKYDGPKGTFPITPVNGKSLFHVHAEKIRATRRRYDCGLPWFIMTSYENHEDTQEFFAEHDFFGLGEDSVHFFPQQMNPILDEHGHLLLEEKDSLLAGPDGHGGIFEALVNSGMCDVLDDGGWDLLSYFQVDNPLVKVADPRFLGHHVQQSAEFSCKVIPKRDPSEGLGIAVLRDNHPAVIEYIDVPPEIAEQRDPSGQLYYLYGSIAIHIMNTGFVQSMAEEGVDLPWHVAEKNYKSISPHSAEDQPQERTCYKFERFIFESLSEASGCAFVETDRGEEFAPVKNAEGEDSPATARARMQRLWAKWLAGADHDLRKHDGSPDRKIEISPLFADSPEELQEKLPADWEPSNPVVLEPEAE
jgi:UDP-N-acetylglucosamine/UDP-N-acetylgalactosamine diphosphorylase